jgi:hypothetical protein
MPKARPLLAMLAALARDPLFMASARRCSRSLSGVEIQRAPIRDALRKLVGERMNDATLDKVVRNVSSSWTQSGHLPGRTFKFRQRVRRLLRRLRSRCGWATPLAFAARSF